MRILLLGGTGYIGSYCERMVAPRGFSILAPPRQRLDLLDHKSVSLFFGEEQPFDSVIYLSTINKNQCTSREVAWKNVTMTENLLSNLKHDGNLIFTSSVDVYGLSPTLPLNEETPLNPESWYAESKVACEQLIGSSLTQGASRHVVLRLPGVYGNVTAGSAILDQMAAWNAGSRNGFKLTNPAVLRDWVLVQDFYRFVLELHKTVSYKHSAVNFATGESLSMIEWLSLLNHSVFKRGGKSPNIPTQTATQDSFDLVFDVSLFSSIYPHFSFTPRHQAVGCYLDT